MKKIKEKVINYLRKLVCKYDLKKCNFKVKDLFKSKEWTFFEDTSKELGVGVYSPVFVVYKVLEKQFGNNLNMLNIYSIDVNTQEEEIKITIKSSRIGFIIGKGGVIINSLESELTNIFNKKTYFILTEGMVDKHKPICLY
jgi:predicted RNA-binding protein YlqC (UPF0109 family)